MATFLDFRYLESYPVPLSKERTVTAIIVHLLLDADVSTSYGCPLCCRMNANVCFALTLNMPELALETQSRVWMARCVAIGK